MTISRYLLIDGSSQIEVFDDCRRAQVEVFLYDFCDFFIGKLPCAIGIYQNGNGLCHADCVSKLYLTFSCNAAGNNIFCNVSCRIASGTVNLCRVLTGECAAAVCRIAAIGIHDNLSACQTGVTHRAADHKSACRVDVIFCVFIQQGGRDYLLDNIFNNILFNLAMLHIGIMLRGHNNGIHSYGCIVLIFHCHLCLAIGAQICQCTVFTHLCQSSCQLMGQGNRQGHQLLCFIAGKAEHHALIAGTCIKFAVIRACFVFQRMVNAQCDIGGLSVDSGQNGAGFAVEAVFCSGVADFCQGFSDDFFNINISLCCNLAHNHNHACCGAGFAGNTGIGVLCQKCVQHAIGNLVTDFIGMSLCNRFGCK